MSYKITIDIDDSGNVSSAFFNQNNVNPVIGGLLISEMEDIKLQILQQLRKFKKYNRVE
jgi:hypothetical protein